MLDRNYYGGSSLGSVGVCVRVDLKKITGLLMIFKIAGGLWRLSILELDRGTRQLGVGHVQAPALLRQHVVESVYPYSVFFQPHSLICTLVGMNLWSIGKVATRAPQLWRTPELWRVPVVSHLMLKVYLFKHFDGSYENHFASAKWAFRLSCV